MRHALLNLLAGALLGTNEASAALQAPPFLAPQSSTQSSITEDHSDAIRQLLATNVTTILGGDLNAAVALLDPEDQLRIGVFDPSATRDFAERAERVSSQWKARFGAPFEATDPKTLFKDATIAPLPDAPDGRRRASISLPTYRGLRPITLHVITDPRHLDRWRLDIPDTILPAEFRTALQQQLSRLETTADTWPSEAREARQLVTHQLLLAFAK